MNWIAKTCCAFMILFCGIAKAQTTDEPKTITIKKKPYFSKAKFDDTFYKVMAVDQNDNTFEEVVKSFTIYLKEGKDVFELKVTGNVFPKKTIEYFTKKRKFAANICITNIMAETKDGHLEPVPDLCDIMLFPNCKNNKHK